MLNLAIIKIGENIFVKFKAAIILIMRPQSAIKSPYHDS